MGALEVAQTFFGAWWWVCQILVISLGMAQGFAFALVPCALCLCHVQHIHIFFVNKYKSTTKINITSRYCKIWGNQFQPQETPQSRRCRKREEYSRDLGLVQTPRPNAGRKKHKNTRSYAKIWGKQNLSLGSFPRVGEKHPRKPPGPTYKSCL